MVRKAAVRPTVALKSTLAESGVTVLQTTISRVLYNTGWWVERNHGYNHNTVTQIQYNVYTATEIALIPAMGRCLKFLASSGGSCNENTH